MRILHIIPNFASGGAERVLLNYLIDWKEMFPTDVIVGMALFSYKGSIFDDEIIEKHIQVEYSNCENGNFFEYISTIHKKVKAFQPDIIHSHMRILPYVYLATLGTGIRIIHTIHTEPEVHAAGKQFALERKCIKSNRVLPVCLTKDLAKRANKLYNINKCEYLYNGIFLERYIDLDAKQRLQLRNQLQIPTDATVIGHVGRFVPIKNHQLIVNAFEAYHKEIDNQSFLILIGEGEEYERIKNLVKQKRLDNFVRMLGVRRDVPHLLQIMNKFIFPSVNEGLGISFIEAQAAGLECVISDAIPNEAIVTNKVYRVSLHDEIKMWVKALAGKCEKEIPFNSLEEFDRRSINMKLRRIYENEKSQAN